MKAIFDTLLYQPILLALAFIYKNIAFADLGVAIIVLTIAIRIVLFPLFYKFAKHQVLMQRIQPHVHRIQREHKDDKEKQAAALMELYREHNINPFGGLGLLLIQFPILIGIYQVILHELTKFDSHLFLGFINLSQKSIPLAVVAAGLQYYYSTLAMPSAHADPKDPSAKVASVMKFAAPALTFVILLSVPAALGVYWATTTALSIGQQFLVNRDIKQRDGKSSGNN